MRKGYEKREYGWMKESESQDQRWKKDDEQQMEVWKICKAVWYGCSLPPVQSASGRGKVNGGISEVEGNGYMIGK